eukprot:TRINITY_DN7242_c0_g1_i6.p1 TRINITY_DN7242_c0_g1~~TRINITY_DN7242_c0_g1_i6.p1  ORF type:complete len:805 (-),score=179.08 TRINITY_DN7242_c0_g1_i6:164-2578(-)
MPEPNYCYLISRELQDPLINSEKQQKWIQRIPVHVQNNIKGCMLSLLSDPVVQVGNQAAQVVARIALIELPQGGWSNLISILLEQVTKPGVPTELKKSTLDTIGYICEEISPAVLTTSADQILTAIIHGMRPQEVEVQVKLAACKALSLALSFCEKNFMNRVECGVIMDSVINAMGVDNHEIRVAAYAVLIAITSSYYSVLAPFIQKLFKITMKSIKDTEEEDLTKFAIEFWCTLADEELSLLEEIEYANKKHSTPSRCEYFVKGAMPFLVPSLNNCLVLQEEDGDPEEWTIPMAAGVCLSLVAQTVKDEVVQYVVPFVEANITSQDWKCREAAVLAFGSILEGPDDFIYKLVTQAMGILLTHLKDNVVAVRDTTAWTIGAILKLHHEAVGEMVEMILERLCQCLGDPSPRVTSHICFAIHNLAVSFADEPCNPLPKHFTEVVKMLFLCSDRPDGDESHLRIATYESLNVVLLTAPPLADETLVQITSSILERLLKTFSMECLSQDDINRQNQLQGLLCGTLQVLSQRLETKMLPFCDDIMMLVIKLFRSKNDSGVYEEGLLTVGAVANVVDTHFQKYMNDLAPHLLTALHNSVEYQVCGAAVGVVGDISRALGPAMISHCDPIIDAFLNNLQKRDLDRSVKPPILSTFGDIALAIGGSFEKYLDVTMHVLTQAVETIIKTTVKEDDYDLMDYVNQLCEGICEAYTGIIQGFRTDKKVDKLRPSVDSILRFISFVSQNKNRTEGVIRGAVGIIGDLATCFPTNQNLKHTFSQPLIIKLVEICSDLKGEDSKETSKWVHQVLTNL